MCVYYQNNLWCSRYSSCKIQGITYEVLWKRMYAGVHMWISDIQHCELCARIGQFIFDNLGLYFWCLFSIIPFCAKVRDVSFFQCKLEVFKVVAFYYRMLFQWLFCIFVTFSSGRIMFHVILYHIWLCLKVPNNWSPSIMS